MKTIVTSLTVLLTIMIVATSLTVAPRAFALSHFFNCITDISNKDGGDKNLTLQQVIDCFHKEFPHNHSSSSDSSVSASASVGDHVSSNILIGP